MDPLGRLGVEKIKCVSPHVASRYEVYVTPAAEGMLGKKEI
jgi:hypothetical protein